MEHSTGHRDQRAGSGRSGRAALNPCCVEDIALTPRELDRLRTAHARVIVPW